MSEKKARFQAARQALAEGADVQDVVSIALGGSPTEERAAWLAERMAYIGATDCAAICGIHPYKTARQVYLEKKGLAEETETNEAMQRGIDLEPYVAELYSRETGAQIEKGGLCRHSLYPFFACNLDYEALHETGPCLLECKTAHYFVGLRFGPIGTDQVPDQYLVQCQWQMYVTGYEVCDLAVLIGGQDFRIYTIRRDDDLIATLETRALAFWRDYIEAECPPPLSGLEPDSEWVKKEFPRDYGDTVTATPEIEVICNHLSEARKRVAVWENAKAELENQIKEYMASASILETPLGPFTWKRSKDGVSVDWETLARSMGVRQEDIDFFSKPKPGTRRFVTPFKE